MEIINSYWGSDNKQNIQVADDPLAQISAASEGYGPAPQSYVPSYPISYDFPQSARPEPISYAGQQWQNVNPISGQLRPPDYGLPQPVQPMSFDFPQSVRPEPINYGGQSWQNVNPVSGNVRPPAYGIPEAISDYSKWYSTESNKYQTPEEQSRIATEMGQDDIWSKLGTMVGLNDRNKYYLNPETGTYEPVYGSGGLGEFITGTKGAKSVTKAGQMALRKAGATLSKAPEIAVQAEKGAAAVEKFAGNIRLNKYPEEIQPILREWAAAHPDLIEEARRGTRSAEQVMADAKQLIEQAGGSFEKKITSWKPGQAWNAEEITALRGVLGTKAQEVYDLSRTIASGDNSTPTLAKYAQAIMDQTSIQQVVSGTTAEAGRALRSFRMPVTKMGVSGDAAKVEWLSRILGNKISPEDLAKAFVKIDVNNPYEVNSFIRSVIKPKWGEYLTEIFYNSILSGPKTHIVNFGSNMLSSVLSPFEKAVAATIEAPLSLIQGRPRQRFYGEVAQELFGLIRGIPEGAKGAYRVLKSGASLDEMAKWEQRIPAFTGKLGNVVNFPTRMLEAADAFGQGINRTVALRSQAFRIASMEKLKGQNFVNRLNELLNNPTEDMLAQAKKIADYRLFRQEPGKFTKRLIGLRDTQIWGAEPLRFIIPFLRTPVNLVKFGLERSPLAALNMPMWKNIITKNPEASDQIARWVIGSTVAAAVGIYAADGKITGAAPTNSAEKDAFYRSGKQPFSIKIGDTWVSYQRMEPFNQPLSQVAAVVEAVRGKKSDTDVAAIAQQAMTTIAKNFVSQTYMSGIANIMSAIEDPMGEGAYMLQQFASGLIPYSALLRTITQGMDPTIRTARSIPEAWQTEIPGMSQNVRPKLNVFGEEQVRETPVYSPINIKSETTNPVDIELERIGVEIGNPSRMIGQTKLDDTQYYNYQKYVGQELRQSIIALMDTPEYISANDTQKVSMVDKVISKTRAEARKQFSIDTGLVTGEEEEKKVYPVYPIEKPKVARGAAATKQSDDILEIYRQYNQSKKK